MKKSLTKSLTIVALAIAMALAFTSMSVAEDITLRITWWAWEPSALLEKLTEDFTKETGIKVIADWNPFGQLHDKVMVAMAAKDPTLDLIIADSQWMGELVEGGHIIELTDWINRPDTSPDLKNFYPNVVSFIGEYPIGSGHHYGLPVIQDGQHLVYRKDLFEDPKEKAAFKAKYGRELRVPQTWHELRDTAEFFTRPKQNLYGGAWYYSQVADTVSCTWNQILWSWGGQLWNPKTKEIEGYVNSPTAVEALEFFVGMKKFCPPGAENYAFEEVLNATQQGLVSMSIYWFAFNPAVIDPNASRVYDKVGFAVLPRGPKAHYVSLGGQAITINKYGKNIEACYKYIDWLFRNKTCEKYAKMGGPTSNKTVLNSPQFLDTKPWNKVILETIPLMRDFWNVTCYAEMMNDEQILLNAAATGAMTPKAALDELARRQTASMKKAGYLK